MADPRSEEKAPRRREGRGVEKAPKKARVGPKGSPTPPSGRTARKPPKAGRAVPKKGGKATAASKMARKPPGLPRRARPAPPVAGALPVAPEWVPPSELGPPLTEEEVIGQAKFSGVPPKRLFEEERFLFPETYGRDRVRLLVRDPQWLFAHFDVDPHTLAGLAQELGERTLALARLALRVSDPSHGGTSLTLLPPGSRSWYVKVDRSRRTYRAELGLLLPSGVFRRLAESNTVATPRVGPSADRARRRVSWNETRESPHVLAEAVDETAAAAKIPPPATLGPWVPAAEAPSEEVPVEETSGGASDRYRR
jgi:hypothetical protein